MKRAGTAIRGGEARHGWGGIRTHGGLAPSPVFKTGALNRSATHPAAPVQASACGAAGKGQSALLATGLLAGLALVPATARAQSALPPPDPRHSITLISENDSFAARTDRYYTNGIRLGYRSPEGALPAPFAVVDRALAGLLGPAQSAWGLSIGQNMYTPRDKARTNPDPRDRPYAGYLYGELTLDRRTTSTLDRVSLQLGMVGPSALAKESQDLVHSILGDRQARGWGRQLKDEPVFNLGWERNWRVPVANFAGIGLDAVPTVGFAAGTVTVYGMAGARLRIGQGLDRDFGPARIRPAIADAPPPVGEGLGWYVFGGVGGRLVAHDMLITGNNWRDSRGVDHRPFVGDLEVGAALIWNGYRLSYTHVWRSKEFVGQRDGFRFGSIALSVAF